MAKGIVFFQNIDSQNKQKRSLNISFQETRDKILQSKTAVRPQPHRKYQQLEFFLPAVKCFPAKTYLFRRSCPFQFNNHLGVEIAIHSQKRVPPTIWFFSVFAEFGRGRNACGERQQNTWRARSGRSHLPDQAIRRIDLLLKKKKIAQNLRAVGCWARSLIVGRAAPKDNQYTDLIRTCHSPHIFLVLVLHF